MRKKETERNAITIHSSAAEYLTFVAASGDASESFEIRYEDENIWLTQKMMATLYGVSVPAISQHIKRIYEDGELVSEATIKKYLTVQREGDREINRNLDHYNLQMIIAVGFKVNNPRAVQFRKWAGQIVKDYTIQGWVMDKERLIKGHMFTDEYFERQLQQIREIRLSERKFYNVPALNQEAPTTGKEAYEYWKGRIDRMRNGTMVKRPWYVYLQTQEYFGLSNEEMMKYFGAGEGE